MEETQLAENKYLGNISVYEEFLKISFKDLVKITKDNKEVFLDLYYNRSTEFNEVKSIFKNIRNRNDNILILGQAGTGKSSFMYKVFYEIEHLDGYKLYPIIVDYHDVLDVPHLLKTFIKNITNYFADMKVPCNTLRENTEENIKHNIHSLKSHLADIEENELQDHLIILLDDFDYFESSHLFEILEIFMGFGASPYVTLVLSSRPALYASINSYDTRLAKNFTRDIHKIELQRLDIKRLISTRLAIILIESDAKSSITKLFDRLIGNETPYAKFLRKMNIENIKELDKISLPFTDLYLNFIRCITDHNIREIFEIVNDSLLYILRNYNDLETITEKEEYELVEKKEIPKEICLKLFFDNTNSGFKIEDINQAKSSKGNSILYNVLEGIKSFREVNDTFYILMNKLGHSKEDVNWAVERLKKPEFAMIEPHKIIPKHITDRIDRHPIYNITKKGDYYLTNLAYWPEYISRCGNFGESLSNIT